ncbi:PIN domain-containing protein [Cryobacterium sp. MDB2-33-2]|uniref:PIN domain-containing protein n=1 Tax=Cryobacterium sp. MDB2-33-2 TaxID=1259179 RepID=UPI00106AFED2|nr:PIN domain-containing protein [Cryobacterium sp. MDB2-33-2]TFC08472.1 hypothetical protein E3O59_08435 [Cryobacterium sp. MDB2-33-2]
MEKRFKGHYGFSPEEIEELWRDGLIVLDTNVLLDLYRQSPPTRSVFLASLQRNRHQLWMPYQVGAEFHRNRTKVAKDSTKLHRDFGEAMRKRASDVTRDLDQIATYDQGVDASALLEDFNAASNRLAEHVKQAKVAYDAERRTGRDEVLVAVDDLYGEANVGEPFSNRQLSKHRRRAAERFGALQPPGYADFPRKSGDQAYGDYFLWAQTVGHAKSVGKGVILVTNDAKEDWRTPDDKPRPELVTEFFQKTGRAILILDSGEFLLEESRRHSRTKEPTSQAITASRELETISRTWHVGDVLASAITAQFADINLRQASALLSEQFKVMNIGKNMGRDLQLLQAPAFEELARTMAIWAQIGSKPVANESPNRLSKEVEQESQTSEPSSTQESVEDKSDEDMTG